MADYQVVKIGNHEERKEHPLLEKAMKIIEDSIFFKKYGNPSKLPYYGISEYGPIWIHQTNSYGTKIMIHVKCPSKIRTVDDAMNYRKTPYYQELCKAVEKLADYINSQLGMNLAKRSTMSADDNEAMVYINGDLLKNEGNMETINEDTIREIVAKSLKKAIEENYFDEYRTKGSLNKKTLEKNAGKSAEDIIADRQAKQAEENDYNPDWDESMEDILNKYREDDEYDDTQAGGEYKADPSDPYFFTKDGKRIDADAIGQFHNDFAIVKKDGKVNFVDNEGVILSDEWFDACNDFEDGFGLVSKDRKRNFIGNDGQLLLGQWVDRAGDFVGGSAPVIINGERHEVDRNGRIM